VSLYSGEIGWPGSMLTGAAGGAGSVPIEGLDGQASPGDCEDVWMEDRAA